MAITSPGIGSGLDVNGIVSQLMSIERQPLNKLDTKEASYQATISALGALKGSLSSLQSAAATLTKATTFAGSYKASSSNSEALTATSSKGVGTGSYNVNVTQLAQSQKLRTAGTYASPSAALGSGTITIQFGTGTLHPTNPDTQPGTFSLNANKATATITIDPAKNTLQDVRDAINAAKAGVTASIVNDGSGYRLAISSNDTGTTNGLKITVANDADSDPLNGAGLSALAYDTTANTRSMKVSQDAKDAKLTIDGIDIVKQSNTISDAVDGLSLTLLKEGVSSTVSVSFDKSGITSSIQAFAKAYNETNKQLRDLTAYDAETKKSGPLQGDAVARSIQSQLRSVLGGNLAHAPGGLTNLSQVGISFDRNGAMTVDTAKLNAAINDPTKDVGTLFTGIAKTTDARISATTTSSKVLTGSFGINISQLATQGSSVSKLLSKVITDAGVGRNDLFGVRIDGISATVTLAANTYTGDALAAEIQSKLNGVAALKNAGSAVTVKYGTTSTLAGDGDIDMVTLLGGDLTFSLYGQTKTIAVNDGSLYGGGDPALLATDMQSKLNAAFGVSNITVAAVASPNPGKFRLSIASDGAQAPPTLDNPGDLAALSVFGASQTSTTGAETLTITSSKFGSVSKIDTLSANFLSGTINTAGQDVAGTIGGIAGKGTGQTLVGDGANAGLSLLVNGGALGDRGTVSYEKGLADKLNDLLSGLVGTKGILSSKTEGVQSSIKMLDARREELNRRLVQIESRYRRQFTSLDTLMSQMTATQNSLAQQLAGLSQKSS